MWSDWLANSKPIMPVIVIHHIDEAIPLAEALLKGGIHLLEVTLRTDTGLQAIQEIAKNCPEAVIGAGTVTMPHQLTQLSDCGAQFAVTPGATEDLLMAGRDWQGEFIPGVATASEAMSALHYGFDRQKLFPAMVVGGIPLLKAWQGPLANIDFCPTGGINQDNYRQFLDLDNVFCVGGSWMVPRSLIEQKNWSKITELALSICPR